MGADEAMITKEDIARGKALCAAASKGPWRRCKAGENCQCGIVWAGDESGMVAGVPHDEAARAIYPDVYPEDEKT
jgi:hypothetical protein